ncbi:J domain-containing protein [Botrimarina hoheduenensis]|uniref:J domain-containing protein n=1 Tax=Botrimarina hoheduenensis TaxID=2528000 RepID=A0A5C5W9G2_9BACT|nr:J domain-containing protein [Botrimarina hoheduenensis]TWT46669.1 hypothetical protein Pla111_17700 [Botrimarina hoheduenensis]
MSDSHDSSRRHKPKHAALERLGLSLPVTQADVKQAYFAKAREVHPDHGGTTEKFVEVQRAFEEAMAYASERGKRLPWLGAQMTSYLDQLRAVELIEDWGGRVVVKSLDWLADTVGEDFALLAEQLVEIDLSGTNFGDAEARALGAEVETLPYVHALNLSGLGMSDEGYRALPRMGSLKTVNLHGTRTTAALHKQLAAQAGMERVETDGWLKRLLG